MRSGSGSCSYSGFGFGFGFTAGLLCGLVLSTRVERGRGRRGERFFSLVPDDALDLVLVVFSILVCDLVIVLVPVPVLTLDLIPVSIFLLPLGGRGCGGCLETFDDSVVGIRILLALVLLWFWF